MAQLESAPSSVVDATHRWLARHDELAPGLVDGLYIVGSATLGDWQPQSDIDIVAFSAEPPSNDDVEQLRQAHLATRADLPGAKIDGPRLTWADVAVPPTALRRPWTLDGDFQHDSDCFELNPVTWYTLATYGISVRGPAPATLDISLDTDLRISFVRDNAGTYWRSVAESVVAAANDSERTSFDAGMTEWCVLGVARMLYTSRTGDLLSKSAAGRWLATEVPQYELLAQRAIDIRNTTDPAPVTRDVVVAVGDAMHHVLDLIAAETD